jgi:hypothetical protein
MYIVRDVFNLKYGHYRPVKALLDEAIKHNLMPAAKSRRILTDFTGGAYRLVMEIGFDTLSDYEKELSGDTAKPEFQEWYKKFVEHVESGYREIMKAIA